MRKCPLSWTSSSRPMSRLFVPTAVPWPLSSPSTSWTRGSAAHHEFSHHVRSLTVRPAKFRENHYDLTLASVLHFSAVAFSSISHLRSGEKGHRTFPDRHPWRRGNHTQEGYDIGGGKGVQRQARGSSQGGV